MGRKLKSHQKSSVDADDKKKLPPIDDFDNLALLELGCGGWVTHSRDN